MNNVKKTTSTAKKTPVKKTTNTKKGTTKKTDVPKIQKVELTEIKPQVKKKDEQHEKETDAYLTVLGIVILAIVAILIFGLTYAYFTATLKDMNPNNPDVNIVSADLLVRYQDGESNIVLGKKIEPGDILTKEFSIKNEGNDTGFYTIVLDKYQNHFDRECNEQNSNSDLSFTLYRLDENGNETSKIFGMLPCANEVSIFTIAKDEKVELIKNEEGNIISDTNYYKLVINYEYLTEIDQSDDMGSLLEARINIVESETEQRTQSTEY